MPRLPVAGLSACFLLLFAVLFSACSIDYESALVLEERPEDVPQTILVEARLTLERQDDRRFQVRASRVESYPELEEQRFWDFAFEEYDVAGDLVAAGQADFALYYDATDDVDLEGNIEFRSVTEGIVVTADELSWRDGERTLSAGPQVLIRVDREDGSWMEGRGFSADFRRSVLKFSGAVEGEIVTEDENE